MFGVDAASLVHADRRGAATRRTAKAILACVVVTAALRAPFVWAGISMDEGGHAHVAQPRGVAGVVQGV